MTLLYYARSAGSILLCSADCAEVMVVIQGGAAGEHADEDSDGSPRPSRSAKIPIERVRRNAAGAGTSAAGALEATIANLGKPVEAKVDPERVQAQLEEHR